MHKVIVERPRWGSSGHYPRGALRPRNGDLEALPGREAMGRGYGWKNLNENLQPLVRYLRSSLGRPWSAVYADISANLSVRSAVQKHVLDHLRDYVYVNTVARAGAVYGADRYGREVQVSPSNLYRDAFYVCPRTGLLRESRRQRHQPPAPDPNLRKLGESVELRRIAGVWYRIEYARLPAGVFVYDHVKKARVSVNQAAWYAESKRQLGKKELAALGL
ncbi:MAG: hypothetical protein JST54_15575 [Deltaproteobacteria bacterium]|nr:hypothetical protein [Deltaproteobacteria bacterium]